MNDTTSDSEDEFTTLVDATMERWRREYRLRRGKAMAPVTFSNRTKALHILNRAAGEVFPDESHPLVKVLEDRRYFLDLKMSLERRVSPGTIRNYLVALREFERHLWETGRISGPVIEHHDMPSKNPPPPITIYTAEELERLLGASWMGGRRWAGLVHFLAATGRRVGEALSLRFDDLHQDAQGFWFDLDRTKSGEQNLVPVPESYAEKFLSGDALVELRDISGLEGFDKDPSVYLFPWHYPAARGRFERMCRRTKVQNRGFHNFRHTVITNRLAAGVPLQAVAALAGHKNPVMTGTRYNHATALQFRRYLEV